MLRRWLKVKNWWIRAVLACVGLVFIAVAMGSLVIDEFGARVQFRWFLLEHKVMQRVSRHDVSGRALYEAHCSNCHGVTGGGGRAPNLRDSLARAGKSDRELLHVVRWGIRDGGMPGFDSVLSTRQIFHIIRHLGELVEIPEQQVRGDPRHGETLFRSRGGCLNCHTLGADGRFFGPDLTRIGTLRGPEYLREKLVVPGKSLDNRFRAGFLQTMSGETVSGIIVHEDTFSVVIRAPSGKLLSFGKSDLKTYRVAAEESLMPSFLNIFTDSELDDLVAFLARQGRQ